MKTELEVKRAELIRQQDDIIKTIENGRGGLNTEDGDKFDSLQRDIVTIDQEIAKELLKMNQKNENQRAIEAERQRITEIQNMCRDFGIDEMQYIKDGTTVNDTRVAVLNNVKKNKTPLRAGDVTDEGDKYRAAATDAMLMRSGINIDKPSPGALEMRSLSLRDLAVETLEREGQQNLRRLSNDELLNHLNRSFFNPTSAFPAILDTTINKAYVQGYQETPVTFDKWVRKGSLKDFKTMDHNYLAGTAGQFLEIPENGELKHDTPVDALKPTRKLKTYGRQFTMSRQSFINDDIGFLTTVPARYAAAAKKTMNKQVYSILTENPVIYDGNKLFDTEHKNILKVGTGVTGDAIQKMMLKMQHQKDVFDDPIIMDVKYIIAPIGYGFAIKSILGSPVIEMPGNTQAINPLYNTTFEVIEDPTINALIKEGEAIPWFMAAAKETAESIQIDYLNGQEIPTIRRSEVPGQLGFVWDIYLDWGITVTDFRGIIKNSGIILTNLD